VIEDVPDVEALIKEIKHDHDFCIFDKIDEKIETLIKHHSDPRDPYFLRVNSRKYRHLMHVGEYILASECIKETVSKYESVHDVESLDPGMKAKLLILKMRSEILQMNIKKFENHIPAMEELLKQYPRDIEVIRYHVKYRIVHAEIITMFMLFKKSFEILMDVENTCI
jgi:tetratricopeptide (TPR) repeat protein